MSENDSCHKNEWLKRHTFTRLGGSENDSCHKNFYFRRMFLLRIRLFLFYQNMYNEGVSFMIKRSFTGNPKRQGGYDMASCKKLFPIALLSALFIVGCSNAQQESGNSKQAQPHTASGDIREETKSAEVLPSFMDDKPEKMKDLYLSAAENRELLENIPCYCGCGESAGHKNNYDCFVAENKKDGTVVWDDHATKCGVCLDIAAISIQDYQNGKSMKEIRDKIDKTYEKGYAEPTPTPKL
jgi:hypothetical protein